ncbi:hypothetical protein ACJMK2_020959 [Sinanodonta woodiana]|uniref:CYTH domain-containing protein n=1 Tax=Sinanodonta woodiana TaxID=1069815 RepID=A0ABD3U0N0_SINWO
MPANVEIKASVADVDSLKQKAAELSESKGTILIQEDVFFQVPKGRLKLRKLQDAPSQLIFYERTDQSGPKFSDYNITQIADPESLKETLGKALGIQGIVKKTRTLYIVGQTRVHVDTVDGLGNFMELEVVLEDGQSVEEGQYMAEDLMSKLGVKTADLVSVSYMDLILKDKKN